jgi:Flp pilus assembly pilin Flp
MERSERLASPRKRLARKLRPRGQAMVEYSLISHFMLIGGSLLLLPMINLLLNAITRFYDSVYTVIQTAAI